MESSQEVQNVSAEEKIIEMKNAAKCESKQQVFMWEILFC